jgi:hypothetical protein
MVDVMAATGLPLVLLTIASLILAGVYVCNSFIMDAWTRHEWNRLDDLRQRVRKARMQHGFAQNRLAKCNETLTNLQLAASQLERHAQASSRRGVVV